MSIFCLLDIVSGLRSLLGAYFVERKKYRGVDGARDVEEGAGDTLHACDAAFAKFWCGCGVWGVLYLGPVRWREPCRRDMGFWKRSRALRKELGIEMPT